MRQRLSTRKVLRLREETGLSIIGATVEGNTEHRTLLFCADGSLFSQWSSKEIRKIKYKWTDDEDLRAEAYQMIVQVLL